MTHIMRISLLIAFLLAVPRPAWAGLISLTVVSGATDLSGSTMIADPILQESLSSSTLTQLGSPLLFDPEMDLLTSLTVRITNTSGADILFPEFLPGVSVLSGINGIPGYTSRLNVGAGGAADRTGGAGDDGAVSRTVVDTAYDLVVEGSPGTVPHGGGGAAGTAVAENWIALRGASGEELAPYLAGLTLAPGQWIDVPGFATITAFHRALEGTRLAIGFDLPTFSSGGISVTTGAWTGTFAEARELPPETEPPTAAAPEPATAGLLVGGLVLGACRGRLLRGRRDRRVNGARE